MEFCRSGVDGRRQKVVLERIRKGGCFVGKRSGYQSYYRIGQQGCRDFAAAHHVVAYGNLSCYEVLPDSVIYSFIMSAQDDDVSFKWKFVRYLLVQPLSVGRHIDDFVVIPFRFEFVYHIENRLHHHNHSGISAVGIVVHVLSGTDAVFSQVVYLYVYQSVFYRTPHYAVAQRAVEQFRDYGKNVYPHISYILFCLQNYQNNCYICPISKSFVIW